MSTSRLDRRRAERFADLLAAGRAHPRHRQSDAGLADLAALTRQLGQVPATRAPDEAFRTGLRTLLIATMERDGLGRPATHSDHDPARAALAGRTQVIRQVPTRGTARARLAMLIGVSVALGLSGVSMASTDALPGDGLYQVKRSRERAQLALAGSDLSRARLLLEFARTRLNEARSVDAERLGPVLTDMNASTRDGATLLLVAAVRQHDEASLDVVLRFVRQQRERLGAVDLASAQQSGSIAMLDAIEQRAKLVRTGLDHDCGMDGMDALGPVLTHCH